MWPSAIWKTYRRQSRTQSRLFRANSHVEPQSKSSIDLTSVWYSWSNVVQSLCPTTRSRLMAFKHLSFRNLMWQRRWVSYQKLSSRSCSTKSMAVPHSLRSVSTWKEFWLLKIIHAVLDFEDCNPFSSAHDFTALMLTFNNNHTFRAKTGQKIIHL